MAEIQIYSIDSQSYCSDICWVTIETTAPPQSEPKPNALLLSFQIQVTKRYQNLRSASFLRKTTHLHVASRLIMRGAIPPLLNTSLWRRA